MQRVCFALVILLAFVAAPIVAHADPILMTTSGSGGAIESLSVSALFPIAGSTTAPKTDANSALTALDFSGDALGAVLFDVPAGTNLPPVETEPVDNAATANLGLGPVVAYNMSGGPSTSPFNFELISNVSFLPGTGPAPKLPPGIRPVAVPEPVTLLLLGPAAALALWRRGRHRVKAAR